MADQADTRIECPICTDVYTDPRTLPTCGHTFCLKCLETFCKDKEPGIKQACPKCNLLFTIPNNGVADLPKKPLLGIYTQMKELSSVESKTSPCEACSGDEESESEVQNVASVYCVECQLRLCQNCSERKHEQEQLNSAGVGPHKVISIEIGESRETLWNQLKEVYLEAAGKKYDEKLDSCKKQKADFHEKTKQKENEVNEWAEELKQMIDDHKEKLMNELSSMKQKRMKEIESLREEIGSYKKCLDKVTQEARAASGLPETAAELLKFDVIEYKQVDLGHADVTFTASQYLVDNIREKLKKVHLNTVIRAVTCSTGTLTGVIPSEEEDDSVLAVTSLDDEVFVVRRPKKGRPTQIKVYDDKTFQRPKRSIEVSPGDWSEDAEQSESKLLKLGLSDDVRNWRLKLRNRPMGLSVNRAHNVVVACFYKPKLSGQRGVLYEYATNKKVVNRIALPMNVQYPRYAVQLSTGGYAVCQWTSPGKISVVEVNGDNYELPLPDNVGHMEYPPCLAVTKNDDILVADEDNNKILAFTKRTRLEVSVQELALPVDGGIRLPHAMFLDESRGRLCVGEFSEKFRVLVFDGVKL